MATVIVTIVDIDVSLWPNDDRSQDHIVTAEVDGEQHVLSFKNYWHSCGATGTNIKCSCGFETGCYSGNGCWQQGHDGPPIEAEFDDLHQQIVNQWGGCWD